MDRMRASPRVNRSSLLLAMRLPAAWCDLNSCLLHWDMSESGAAAAVLHRMAGGHHLAMVSRYHLSQLLHLSCMLHAGCKMWSDIQGRRRPGARTAPSSTCCSQVRSQVQL